MVLTMMGQGQKPEGPDAVEQMIDYMHQQAFEARPEIKNVVGNDQAAVEFDFVGKHTGEFAGMAATERDVRVPYCVVYDLEGEKIKALRLYFPMDALQRQLGDSPATDRSEEASPMWLTEAIHQRPAAPEPVPGEALGSSAIMADRRKATANTLALFVTLRY